LEVNLTESKKVDRLLPNHSQSYHRQSRNFQHSRFLLLQARLTRAYIWPRRNHQGMLGLLTPWRSSRSTGTTGRPRLNQGVVTVIKTLPWAYGHVVILSLERSSVSGGDGVRKEKERLTAGKRAELWRSFPSSPFVLISTGHVRTHGHAARA